MNIIYCEDVIPKDLNDTLVLLPDYYKSGYSYFWDDYGYKTTFKAKYYFKGNPVELGYLKILFKDIEHSHNHIKKTYNKIHDGTYEIPFLDSNSAVSIGTNIDFYKKLKKTIVKNRTIKKLLKKINDICYSAQNMPSYQSWPGFNLSLLRDATDSAILRNGYAVALGNYKKLKEFEFEVFTQNKQHIKFHFDKSSIFCDNINVLIGKNGLGKSRTLKSISDQFTGIEESDVDWPFFNRLIVISFSPFENFLTESELLELKKHSNNFYSSDESEERHERYDLINDYSYIGFKSSKSDEDISLSESYSKSVSSVIFAIKDDIKNGWIRNYSKFSLILESLKLAMEFETIALKGVNTLIKEEELHEFSNSIENPKIDSKLNNLELIFLDENENEIKLSSGQKIYSLLIPSIVSEIKEESLILFDEPELYLHPELEVSLISMLKLILKQTSSFGIIATHSSYIVREIRSDFVHILKEGGIISSPQIETFGNSLDEITGYIFNDYKTVKPYQQRLDFMLKDFESIDDAILHLSDHIGDAALAYLFKLKQKKNS